MKINIGLLTIPALLVLASITAPAIANDLRVESDGHHHFKLHVPKGYYISHENLEKLCHESKDDVSHHAEAMMHKADGNHDGHDQKVECDGGHSLETIHDAH